MSIDLPPNGFVQPPSEVRYAEEQAKLRKKEEEERRKAIEADVRLKNLQKQQID